MAIKVDPDDLNQGTEIDFLTGTLQIRLNFAGNLANALLDPDDGASLKAIYSFAKEEWKDDPTLIPFLFPFVPLGDESFELVNGWDWADDATRYMIRTSGWAVKNTSGNLTQLWSGIIGLGSVVTNQTVDTSNDIGFTAPDLITSTSTNFTILFTASKSITVVTTDGTNDGLYQISSVSTNQIELVQQTITTQTPAAAGATVTLTQSDQLYFDQSQGRTDIQRIGQVNQAVQVLDDPNGDGVYTDGFDYRTQFDLYGREQAQIYDKSTLSSIGVTGNMQPIAYRFPLGTANNLKITASDNTIDTTAPYTGMSITYYATPQARNIGGVSYNFGVIVDGNSGTLEQINEFVDRQLRKATDIDAGASGQIGNISDELMLFVGNNLETLNVTNNQGGGTGVFIDNIQAADTNRISFRDNTAPSTPIGFPFVAVVTIDANANLQNDAVAIWRAFYTTNPAGNYGTSNAVLVHTNDEVEDTANDIGFTAPDLITSTTTTFTDFFAVGEYIHVVTTDGTNDGYYEIDTISANQIQLIEQTITTQTPAAAGATVTLSQTAMGKINGNASIQFDYDYDNNVQGGRTAGTDADITVVAIGLATAQYVNAVGTIQESTQNTVSLVSPLERNYSNP